MATPLDSLLVILNLDVKQFTQAQREAVEQFKKTQEELKRQGKGIEQETGRMIQFFEKLRAQAIGVTAALFGASTIKEFTTQLILSDAALARQAASLNVSATRMGAWGAAAEALGSASGSVAIAIGTIQQRILDMQMHGGPELLAVYDRFRQLTGVIIDRSAPAETQLLQMADAIKKMVDAGKAPEAINLLNRIGLGSPDTFNVLRRGREALQQLHLEMLQIQGDLEQSSKDAEKLVGWWGKLTTSAISLGRELLELGGEGIRKVLGGERAPEAVEGAPRTWRIPFGTPGGTAPGPGAAVPVKPGAGEWSPWTQRVREALAGMPGIRVSSLNDPFHGGRGMHGLGLALDLGLEDPSQREATMAAIRERLRRQGVAANVAWHTIGTAPHVHISSMTGVPRVGAPFAARTSVNNATSNTEVNINGPINIQSPSGDPRTHAAIFLDEFNKRLDRQAKGMQAATGLQ